MGINIVIRAWAAWAPGLHDRSQWLAWAALPVASPPRSTLESADLATVADMPPMARRRLGPLGRSAAQVIYQLADDVAPHRAEVPMLLASRYGDASRSVTLLDEVVRSEPVSPTAFSLSVHNAIGAVVSIARTDRAPQTALAGGACSAGHALIEAAGWLADGTPELILVSYDHPLPSEYSEFQDETPSAYAWAWRIAAVGSGEAGIGLNLTPQGGLADSADQRDLPFGLALLRFALGGARDWERVQEGQRWRWQRHV